MTLAEEGDDVALKPDEQIAAKMSAADRTPSVPVLYEAEIEDHLRDPAVQARLRRVKLLVEKRAQQKS